MTPQVETLAQSMASLAGGFNEQRGLINEQISGLDSLYGSKREALEGTRVKAFNTINDQATGRGASFSGVPLNEQIDHLSDKYLPGLTGLAEQQNSERMQYRQNIAQLNTQQQNAALSRIDQQQASLNQWNLQQAQLEAQRREAELNRQFETAQNTQNRAASSAASQGATPTAAQYLTDWATKQGAASGKAVNKSFAWEDQKIGSYLKANYGVADPYAYRKQVLGY